MMISSEKPKFGILLQLRSVAQCMPWAFAKST
jgi:hypothetical protein